MPTIPGQPPAYAVAPNQYEYEVFADVAQHAELTGAAIEESDIGWALPAIVGLGRVALANDNLYEFRMWEWHAATFIDELYDREGLASDPAQYNRHLAEMRFFGAQGGDATAADALHEMIDEGGTQELHTVVGLCAEHDILPDGWIAQHAQSAEARAAAWATYAFRKRFVAQQTGDMVATEALRRHPRRSNSGHGSGYRTGISGHWDGTEPTAGPKPAYGYYRYTPWPGPYAHNGNGHTVLHESTV
jgi:hypothetical protein